MMTQPYQERITVVLPRVADASVRIVRIEDTPLTAARVLADLVPLGLRPQVCGIPQDDDRIALLFWCSEPHDLVPLVRLINGYKLHMHFGPFFSLPESDKPASVLLCGKLLWRWLSKHQRAPVTGGAA